MVKLAIPIFSSAKESILSCSTAPMVTILSPAFSLFKYHEIPSKLLEAGIIDKNFSEKMQKMVGFRNRAIHNYPSLDEKQLYEILQKDIEDFKEFLEIANFYMEKI